MLCSTLINELKWIMEGHGDREVVLSARKNGKEDKIQFEIVSQIRVTYNDASEPYTLYGNSMVPIIEEKLIHLNWLGVFLKRYITK